MREMRGSELKKRKRNDFVKSKKILSVDIEQLRKLRESARQRRKRSASARKKRRSFVRNVL